MQLVHFPFSYLLLHSAEKQLDKCVITFTTKVNSKYSLNYRFPAAFDETQSIPGMTQVEN